MARQLKTYNLKLLIEALVSQQPKIEEIWIFGSRAYHTGSPRSDCDLLVKVPEDQHVKASELRDFSQTQCPALDFFLAVNGRATSCSNDSFVHGPSFEALSKRLDAKKLWSTTDGFSDFEFSPGRKWVFETLFQMTFIQTVLADETFGEASWQDIIKTAETAGLPVRPYIGDTVDKATAQISDIARKMILHPAELCQKGLARHGWTVNLASEYDCQNLFLTVVKPWLPNIGREEVAVIYDGQRKLSDFSLFDGQLIIEMKFIDSDAKKSEVVKTLSGLASFYSRNAGVRCLLFLIFHKCAINIDKGKWEADYTYYRNIPAVITQVIPIP